MWFAANTPRGSGAGDTSGDAAAVAEQRRALRRRGVSPAPRRRQTSQARRRSGGKDHDLHAHIRALERTVEHSARQMEEMERRFAALSPGPQLSPQQPPPPVATAQVLEQTTPEQRARYDEIFDHVGAAATPPSPGGADASLSAETAHEFLAASGLSGATLQRIFARAVATPESGVSRDEFAAAVHLAHTATWLEGADGLAEPADQPAQTEPAAAEQPTSFSLNLPDAAARSALWSKLDANANGLLSMRELTEGFARYYPQLASLEHHHHGGRILARASKAADCDQNGLVTKGEFSALVDFVEYFGNLWERFDELDRDHSNTLDQSKSPQRICAFFADATGRRQVSFWRGLRRSSRRRRRPRPNRSWSCFSDSSTRTDQRRLASRNSACGWHASTARDCPRRLRLAASGGGCAGGWTAAARAAAGAAPLASSGPHAAQAARVSASNIPARDFQIRSLGPAPLGLTQG